MDLLLVDWSGAALPDDVAWQRRQRPPFILHPEYVDGEVPGENSPHFGLELGHYTAEPNIPWEVEVPQEQPPHIVPHWAPDWVDLPQTDVVPNVWHFYAWDDVPQ
eukprot:4879678-Pyramimonas_sp.AAC.1